MWLENLNEYFSRDALIMQMLTQRRKQISLLSELDDHPNIEFMDQWGKMSTCGASAPDKFQPLGKL